MGLKRMLDTSEAPAYAPELGEKESMALWLLNRLNTNEVITGCEIRSENRNVSPMMDEVKNA